MLMVGGCAAAGSAVCAARASPMGTWPGLRRAHGVDQPPLRGPRHTDRRHRRARSATSPPVRRRGGRPRTGRTGTARPIRPRLRGTDSTPALVRSWWSDPPPWVQGQPPRPSPRHRTRGTPRWCGDGPGTYLGAVVSRASSPHPRGSPGRWTTRVPSGSSCVCRARSAPWCLRCDAVPEKHFRCSLGKVTESTCSVTRQLRNGVLALEIRADQRRLETFRRLSYDGGRRYCVLGDLVASEPGPPLIEFLKVRRAQPPGVRSRG